MAGGLRLSCWRQRLTIVAGSVSTRGAVAALLVGFVVLALQQASAQAGPAGGRPLAFVAAENSSQLVAVDLTTSGVIARIRVPRGPHNVADAVIAGRPYVIVTSPPAGAVTLVDARARRVVKVFRGLGSPHDVEVQGSRAYVTDEARGRLVVVGLRSRRILAQVDVGAGPHDVVAGDAVVVTHGPGDAHVTVVEVSDLGRPRTSRRLRAGGSAHDITKQPDSATVYVTYWNSGLVGALDRGRGRLLWQRRVGMLVHHVQFDYFQGRTLWATDHETGETFLVSARNGRVLRTLGGCAGAHHVALSGTVQVVVACHDSDAIAVFDRRTWRRTLIPVGDGPHGVAVAVVP
jgi:DNA-binding beta-propeller fold protein YncE